MPAPLTLTAQQAADLLGYGSAAAFRQAVARGVFPGPIDPGARPKRWSRPALEAALQPKALRRDDGENRLDKMLGLQL